MSIIVNPEYTQTLGLLAEKFEKLILINWTGIQRALPVDALYVFAEEGFKENLVAFSIATKTSLATFNYDTLKPCGNLIYFVVWDKELIQKIPKEFGVYLRNVNDLIRMRESSRFPELAWHSLFKKSIKKEKLAGEKIFKLAGKALDYHELNVYINKEREQWRINCRIEERTKAKADILNAVENEVNKIKEILKLNNITYIDPETLNRTLQNQIEERDILDWKLKTMKEKLQDILNEK